MTLSSRLFNKKMEAHGPNDRGDYAASRRPRGVSSIWGSFIWVEPGLGLQMGGGEVVWSETTHQPATHQPTPNGKMVKISMRVAGEI